jgi:hypothetical protein
MLSNIWVWDPGSEIRGPGSGKTYSGSRIQGSKRHRIPDPQHCLVDSTTRHGHPTAGTRTFLSFITSFRYTGVYRTYLLKSRAFLLFLLDDGRIRVRTSAD